MHLYLDTADRAAAEPLLATGLFAGLTTNPTILHRAGLGVADIPDIYRWASAAGAREIFFQAWGLDVPTLTDRAKQLREHGPDVVVKLVASKEGSAACAQIAALGIPTLLTAVHTAGQAMIAAAAGATYIAPYLGRLDDAGRDGPAEVLAMHEVLTATGSSTQVLVASVRDVASMVSLARRGVRCFTVGPAVAEQFFRDDLTAEAVTEFEVAVEAGAR